MKREKEASGQPAENYEYSTLMRLMGVGVSKHLLDGHFTCIWANDYFYNLIGYTKAEFASRYHNRADEYFCGNQEGWELLKKSVGDAMRKGEKGNSVYLPLVRFENEHFWVKLQAAFTEEYIDGCQVAYTTLTDVTEMMQAQQEQEQTRLALEQMIQEQKMLMNILKVSVSKHIFDNHFTCVWANEYYYQLIGYPKDNYEALFHNHPDEYYANNLEGWEQLCTTVAHVLEQGGNQYSIISRMKHEDGSSFWVKMSSYFTDEYIGGYRSTYTVMTDVTDLVQMKNEQEMLMQAMKVSVSRHLVDEHYTVVWANEFYYKLIGYTKDEYEALFHNHCDEYYKDDAETWDKIHNRIQDMYAADEKSYELFAPLKIPDGSTRWVKMTGFFTDEYQDGKQLSYTTMVDVTDLMQMQQEKAVAYDNIPGFIVKHRILPESICMIDASDRITDIFNVDMDNLASFDVYAVMTPESRAVIRKNHPCFRKGKPFDETICATDKNGRECWFRIHSTCIDSIAGDPVYLTIFIDVTDITQLRELKKKLEERTELLNAALEEAKHSAAAKSDFLSRMSHDIRTPMNAIMGMNKIIATHLYDSNRIMDCVGKIDTSSKLLLSLINEVLDMSKIESGRIVLAEEEVDLAELVQGAVNMIQPQILDKSLVFKTYANHLSHEVVISDMQRLQQILLNLLSNAVKYTPEGGTIQMDISEKAAIKADMVQYEFVVSDTGIGMKPEFLSRVFEPFERADDVKIQAVQGTGLGLSICKSVVETMGGTILVESTYGKGSKFTVTICFRVQEERIDEKKLAGLTVLVVDDDENVCCNTCGRLEELGIVAEWVTDGGTAVAKVEQAHAAGQDYFAVILDYKMPGLDGVGTTLQIRERVGNSLPVIMISAYDLSEQVDAAKQAGVNDFITKPLFRSRLMYKLGQFIDGCVNTAAPLPLLSGSYVGKRILVVEDNALNREIVTELMLNVRVEADTAENGKEAVDKVAASEPSTYDLIFMDMQMPVMDGCTATIQIRALPREDVKTLPIIAMTANAFADDRQKTKEAGMDDHLVKPIDMEQLQLVLEKWL